ncbi:MAG: YchJ family protein [Desulfosarcina sp.]|nr:YchJ family protein [Desulfobacterales bacterium]
MDLCPCGSEREYSECCQPLVEGGQTAETAEALMRARYSAYVTTAVDFIIDTTHTSQRSNYTTEGIRKWSRSSEWKGLTIVRTERGGPEDKDGTVEFVARYIEKGRSVNHHEIAQFRREESRWVFYDGEAPKPRTVKREAPKVGRNVPCPCGSGKKFKKCCGA